MNLKAIKNCQDFLSALGANLKPVDVVHLASFSEESLMAFELADLYNCTPHKYDIEYLFDLLESV